MGQELAQRPEWKETHSLDWHLLQHDSHRGIQRLVNDLNHLYAAEPALHQVDFDWHGFEWIDANDADNSVLAFMMATMRSSGFLPRRMKVRTLLSISTGTASNGSTPMTTTTVSSPS